MECYPWNGEHRIESSVATSHSTGKLDELNFGKSFDIILANINKNILLEELPLYSKYLSSDGKLLMSGFYESDVEELIRRGNELGLSVITSLSRDSSASVLMDKLIDKAYIKSFNLTKN